MEISHPLLEKIKQLKKKRLAINEYWSKWAASFKIYTTAVKVSSAITSASHKFAG